MSVDIQKNTEVGFGKTEGSAKRLMNRDGSYNYIRKGIPWYESFNFYHFLSSCSWLQFLIIVLIWYTLMNLIFTGLFYLGCVSNLTGLVYKNEWEKFMEVYFFSAQTLTTVGYGRINPTGITASALASLEALFGLLSFALFTGLIYGRFAKPIATLRFSENAVIGPYHDGTALMFRVANKVNSSLMNMKMQVTISILEFDEMGKSTRKFFSNVNLERDSIVFFPSTWTVVHPIDESSPLFNLDRDAFVRAQPEVMILTMGFDETFDRDIHARQSFAIEDIIWGAKYVKILDTDDEGFAVLDFGRFNHYDVMQVDNLVGIPTSILP